MESLSPNPPPPPPANLLLSVVVWILGTFSLVHDLGTPQEKNENRASTNLDPPPKKKRLVVVLRFRKGVYFPHVILQKKLVLKSPKPINPHHQP